MQIAATVAEIRDIVRRWRKDGETIGFVPTMGNLHAGHLHLVAQARHRQRAVVSLFVNPLQFGAGEDYDRYPRTRESDLRALQAEAVDAVFVPDVGELYPPGFSSSVSVGDLARILCGEFRPNHFDGVATVVLKLFNIVQPDRAFFGLKDYQQWVVIRRLVQDLSLPIEVIGIQTVREKDGLAMSSRNQYLDPQERRVAPRLYQALRGIKDQICGGNRKWQQLEQAGIVQLKTAGFVPQYISIRRAVDLTIPDAGDSVTDLVVLAAAYLGDTRLIDNVICTDPG